MENKQTIFVGTGILIVTGLIIWAMMVGEQSTLDKYKTLSTRDVAQICTTDMATQFHIHPELTIIIDGNKQTIPAEIGITPTCMNSIHTHDDTGVIHIESPVQRDFTLGDFFAVWKQPFDAMHILDKTAMHAGQITMTINGKSANTFENTILKDKDQIVISYQSK
jgi:hypothetical protein